MLSSTVGTLVIGALVIPVVFWLASLIGKIVKLNKLRGRVNQLPGLPVKFVIGNLHQVPKPFDERFFKWIRSVVAKNPYAFRFQLSPFRATAFVCHPKTIKQILKTSEPKDIAMFGTYKMLLPWLGDGLLISYGEKWFRNRRLLTPAFHFDILKPYLEIYNECCEILMDKWKVQADNGKAFDIYGDVSLCTLNVIMRCAFSCEEDVQSLGTAHPYVQAVYQLAEISANRQIKPMSQIPWWFKMTAEGKNFDRLCKYVHEVADDIIEKRKKTLEIDGVPKNKRLDFLDILLSARDEDGQGLTDAEIRHEVDTFLFEGHDTTASGISWILYAFATHPEHQQRAREEIDELLQNRESNRIQWDDLNKLEYTSQCIKEAMRLYTPVPGVSRLLTKPLTIEGVELLPGTAIVIGMYAMHHNPAVWGEDHMEFKPERFLHENISKMDSYAFCPFSAGSRNCIGQNFAMNEIKTLICRVLNRYILEIEEGAKPAEPIPNLVMRPVDGIHIKFIDRQKDH